MTVNIDLRGLANVVRRKVALSPRVKQRHVWEVAAGADENTIKMNFEKNIG